MYNDIGKKIKDLAQIIFFILTIISVVAGILIITTSNEPQKMIFDGIVVIIGGLIFARVVSICLYGFGEQIDKTCEIESLMRAEHERKLNHGEKEDKKTPEKQ